MQVLLTHSFRVVRAFVAQCRVWGRNEVRRADGADNRQGPSGADHRCTVGQGPPGPTLYVGTSIRRFRKGRTRSEKPITRNSRRNRRPFSYLDSCRSGRQGFAGGRFAVFRRQSGPETAASGWGRHLQVVFDITPNHKKARGGSCPQITRGIVF